MKLSQIRSLLNIDRDSIFNDGTWFDLTTDGETLEKIFPGCSVHWDRWPHWTSYVMRVHVWSRHQWEFSRRMQEPGKLARLYAILCDQNRNVLQTHDNVRHNGGLYYKRTMTTAAWYSTRCQRWCVIR